MIATITPLILAAATASATPSPQDLQNVALSTAIVRRVGDRLWPDWSKTPFAIDLITSNGPALLNVDAPFAAPKFPPDLEATLVLASGPIIVIGQPQYTQAATPVRWSVTLLHEHFHQWQYSWPQYESSVKALDLARGDRTAMWMLEYAFPYADAHVDAAYAAMAAALADALDAQQTPAFAQAVQRYLSARAAFKQILSADDYRYFAFQCWQEGTARYTEIAVAQLAAQAHAEDAGFLSDAQSAALLADADATYAAVLRRLRTVPLKQDGRVDFYALGAGEAMLLDRVASDWHGRYLDSRMDLSVFFPAVTASPTATAPESRRRAESATGVRSTRVARAARATPRA